MFLPLLPARPGLALLKVSPFVERQLCKHLKEMMTANIPKKKKRKSSKAKKAA